MLYKELPFLIVEGATLYQTCGACPEQYDVFFNGTQIGYLRLRRGRFSASYPDYGGVGVFSASPKGDGIFDEDERMDYLSLAVKALIKEHNRHTLDKLYACY